MDDTDLERQGRRLVVTVPEEEANRTGFDYGAAILLSTCMACLGAALGERLTLSPLVMNWVPCFHPADISCTP
jgi:hypothetical protein